MKKTIFLILLLAVCAIGCSSVADRYGKSGKSDSRYVKGSGDNYVWTPSISNDLQKIDNYLSLDIEYSQGPASLKITGPEKEIDCIRVRTVGSKIEFTLKPGVRSADFSKVKCTISLPGINEVTLHGSGDFMAKEIVATLFNGTLLGSGDLRIGTLLVTGSKFLLRGSGDVKIGKAESTTLQFLTQGSGDITVEDVSTTTLEMISQGSGDGNFKQVTANILELRCQGSGDIIAPKIEVTSLKAVAQGSGDISVGGTATTANLVVQGSGDISARRLKCERVNKTAQGSGDIHI